MCSPCVASRTCIELAIVCVCWARHFCIFVCWHVISAQARTFCRQTFCPFRSIEKHLCGYLRRQAGSAAIKVLIWSERFSRDLIHLFPQLWDIRKAVRSMSVVSLGGKQAVQLSTIFVEKQIPPLTAEGHLHAGQIFPSPDSSLPRTYAVEPVWQAQVCARIFGLLW